MMDRLQCKACRSYSMLPMELDADESDDLGLLTDEQEARFFTCHVCGDNWLTVRRVEEGDCKITFVHQMGLQPLLKRTAHMSTPVLLSEDTVEHWDYYLGDDEVGEGRWRDTLDERRRVLRSICSN
ncbi:hypothetical protein [Rubrivirga sp. IMCC43871]|uniref:hypothetical protein n=1 Tax=Rubrivirga sp. IMCC43871 TaxID=3391575 RepID=UPI00398FB277